jgi:hypothetical protein
MIKFLISITVILTCIIGWLVLNPKIVYVDRTETIYTGAPVYIDRMVEKVVYTNKSVMNTLTESEIEALQLKAFNNGTGQNN